MIGFIVATALKDSSPWISTSLSRLVAPCTAAHGDDDVGVADLFGFDDVRYGAGDVGADLTYRFDGDGAASPAGLRRLVRRLLREGNFDRRAPSVKNYAKTHPHRMGAWTAESKTNVATMDADDFRSTEKSVVLEADNTLRIEFTGADGETTVLRESIPVLAGEVVDSSVMHVAALDEFLTAQIARAKAEGGCSRCT